MTYYADSSALVKLLAQERESEALRSWVSTHGADVVTGDLSRTEVLRAVRRYAPDHLGAARGELDKVTTLGAPSALFDEAARLDPVELRSLDAIHLASALRLGAELAGIVTYDSRMASAATALGIPVVSPG